MSNKFNNWNIQKQTLNNIEDEFIPYFREWQVWFIAMWINIWFEQDGKNTDFRRPVLILKKFNKEIFLWIPLTKTKREWKFYFELEILKEFKSYALLSQIRLYSSKRLLSHIWWINNINLDNIKQKISSLII